MGVENSSAEDRIRDHLSRLTDDLEGMSAEEKHELLLKLKVMDKMRIDVDEYTLKVLRDLDTVRAGFRAFGEGESADLITDRHMVEVCRSVADHVRTVMESDFLDSDVTFDPDTMSLQWGDLPRDYQELLIRFAMLAFLRWLGEHGLPLTEEWKMITPVGNSGHLVVPKEFNVQANERVTNATIFRTGNLMMALIVHPKLMSRDSSESGR